MSCEPFEGETIDVAAGRPPSAVFETHLEGCPACRARLDEGRRVLKEVDRVLGTRLGAEPSAELAARVASRLAEADSRERWRPLWVAPIAAGIAAALLAGWVGHRRDRDVPAMPRHAATAPEDRRPVPAPRLAPMDRPVPSGPEVLRRRRVVAARVRPQTPPRAGADATAAGGAEPLVLVPSGAEDAMRRFLADLRRGTQPAPPLLTAGASVEGAVETPPLLEIPAVTVEPLSGPTVSPERSQR